MGNHRLRDFGKIKRPAVMSEPAGLVNSEAIHKVYICIIADEKGKSNEI